MQNSSSTLNYNHLVIVIVDIVDNHLVIVDAFYVLDVYWRSAFSAENGAAACLTYNATCSSTLYTRNKKQLLDMRYICRL